MQISKKVREQMLRMCVAIGDDDGRDARGFNGTPSTDRHHNQTYRQLRLCRQISQTLSLVLSYVPDEELRGLQVDAVEPGKNMSCLTVRLRPDTMESPVSRDEILGRLRKLEGWLCAELAASITRKRVPRLKWGWSHRSAGEIDNDE